MEELAEKIESPVIQVLLATFNGEKYIGEFLKSLSEQQGVKVHLLVSDDGSTDGTIAVLESFRQNFEKVNILHGPGRGPSENFFWLLENASGKYVAFADQDDLWSSNHLLKSIQRLANFSQTPALTFCQVIEYDQSTKRVNVWPKQKCLLRIEQVLAENWARGCTIVFNSKLLEFLKQSKPEKAIMHDWWALLVAISIGQVIYEPSPELRYRVHDTNFTRKKRQFLAKIPDLQKKQEWAPLKQVHELNKLYRNHFHDEICLEVDRFLKGFTGKFTTRVKYSLRPSLSLRMKFRDSIRIRLGILFFPFFFDTTT